MASEFSKVLYDLGLTDCQSALNAAGISSWDQILTLTKLDLDSLDIRRGSLRKLQRAIARAYNWPDNKPLPTDAELERLRRSRPIPNSSTTQKNNNGNTSTDR
ncbi:hypothetical protein K3495_g8982 [Podosphaera aphanis]|nr:hypothetical protein K3495_g8982 [Podosphaera aphanis]